MTSHLILFVLRRLAYRSLRSLPVAHSDTTS
uniref:Uncharacterized protein n=1 Tax=virus sp. ct6zJ3 TaxID=2826792 RepID=A0A8S5R994_9VIRU|nr:MAG TPA: hypothetical protein [virus sp. ct6zJ3]DAI66016.1 MAG TPA: hypothetical protein [Bacteriophage sp.]